MKRDYGLYFIMAEKSGWGVDGDGVLDVADDVWDAYAYGMVT